jgi:hypothetical protein
MHSIAGTDVRVTRGSVCALEPTVIIQSIALAVSDWGADAWLGSTGLSRIAMDRHSEFTPAAERLRFASMLSNDCCAASER